MAWLYRSGYFYKPTEAALAASKYDSKCSHSLSMLRFFVVFGLAIIGLIEFIKAPFWLI